MASKFIPRQVFPHHGYIPKSYFLGHHKSGLQKMKKKFAQMDYLIECRDYRTPVSSINPAFEELLGDIPDTRRLIVYTKSDLGADQLSQDRMVRKTIKSFDPRSEVFFLRSLSSSKYQGVTDILEHLKMDPFGPDKLTGVYTMIVGMPNVGKSTLINSLRNQGLHKGKVLKTGGQPGITRKIASPVKIIEREDGRHVYVSDTPGVFVPYMHDSTRMLKLALCGCVKDGVISPIILADYLLYQINLHDPQVYQRWSEPTNEITEFLGTFAQRIGALMKGGSPDIESAALRFIQTWRAGKLGKFLLDDLQEEERQRLEGTSDVTPVSMTQAMQAYKMRKREGT